MQCITSYCLYNTFIYNSYKVGTIQYLMSVIPCFVFSDFNSICSEFLLNVISSVDGERDPRNLLLLFSFLPRLFSSVSLGPLVEDAFEVVSCYFPIDFNPVST